MEGISAPWGAAKAILILGSHRVFEVETSEVVHAEVVGALQRKGLATGSSSDFARLMRELRLSIHPRPSEDEVRKGIAQYLALVRHRADMPVLVAAVAARPDWLVSGNPSHFTPEVARATGLRIVTPAHLMRYLSISEVPRRR
ncbi:MAG: hypothetical protein HYY04_11020 [Chloroflexi bacterium]|nr:hypothetical protein [Chloroflexota bacterium]